MKYILKRDADKLKKSIGLDENVSYAMVIRDIAEKIKNEEAQLVKAQYNILNNIIQNLEVGLVRFSYPELKILDVNNKIIEYIRQAYPDYKLGDGWGFIPQEDKAKLMEILRSMVNGGSQRYVMKNFLSGNDVFIKFIFQPLLGINKQIVEVIVILIDITEEVKAKNKMEETLKIQDEIFTNVSHELKTPLNVIFSTNQLLKLYLQSNSIDAYREKIERCTNIIKQNCYRFTKLINNIVDLSKIDSGFYKLNLNNENIVEIVENIVQSIAEYVKGKGLSITFNTDQEEKIIACDSEKIERIILNLISNAIKFTNVGGEIFVNIECKEEFVEISIRDTGVGIHKKYLDSIFKRYHQVDRTLARNAEGSGIGLSLVRSIIDMHGGRISVESEVGKGSNFIVELPDWIIEEPAGETKNKTANSKIEMINIEFSDIYN